MRKGSPSGDHLILDNETWNIVDTSFGKTVFCGVCSGYALYGTRSTIRNNYTTYLDAENGILRIAKVNNKMHPSDWRYQYDQFVAGRGLDDNVPYTGWMLLSRGTLYTLSFGGFLGSSSAKEAYFEDGRLVELIDISSKVETLNAEFSGLSEMGTSVPFAIRFQGTFPNGCMTWRRKRS